MHNTGEYGGNKAESKLFLFFPQNNSLAKGKGEYHLSQKAREDHIEEELREPEVSTALAWVEYSPHFCSGHLCAQDTVQIWALWEFVAWLPEIVVIIDESDGKKRFH